MNRTFTSGCLALAVAVLATLASPNAASAHIILWARPSIVNAPDAILSINAAAESETAGIAKLEVTGPSDLDASGISIQNGPPGWLAETGPTPNTFTVAAPNNSGLPLREDLFISLNVKKLPGGTETFFQVKQTYTDGWVQDWNQKREKGKEEPPQPEPRLYLEPVGSTGPQATSSNGSVPAATPNSTTTTATPTQSSDLNTGLAIVLAVSLALLVFVVARDRIKRKRSQSENSTNSAEDADTSEESGE